MQIVRSFSELQCFAISLKICLFSYAENFGSQRQWHNYSIVLSHIAYANSVRIIIPTLPGITWLLIVAWESFVVLFVLRIYSTGNIWPNYCFKIPWNNYPLSVYVINWLHSKVYLFHFAIGFLGIAFLTCNFFCNRIFKIFTWLLKYLHFSKLKLPSYSFPNHFQILSDNLLHKNLWFLPIAIRVASDAPHHLGPHGILILQTSSPSFLYLVFILRFSSNSFPFSYHVEIEPFALWAPKKLFLFEI